MVSFLVFAHENQQREYHLVMNDLYQESTLINATLNKLVATMRFNGRFRFFREST